MATQSSGMLHGLQAARQKPLGGSDTPSSSWVISVFATGESEEGKLVKTGGGIGGAHGRMGGDPSSAGTAKDHVLQAGGEARGAFPLSPQEEPTRLAPWFRTSAPLSGEGIHFSRLKPPALW